MQWRGDVALNATTEKRDSKAAVKDYRRIMNTVRHSEIMQKQKDSYQKDFEYAADIAFEDACDAVVQLMDLRLIVKAKVENRDGGKKMRLSNIKNIGYLLMRI